MVKRTFDILLASLGLLLLSPFFALAWLAIKLDDGNAVLFRQVRIGKGGETFVILKFRSMRPEGCRTGSYVTARGDPRITNVGIWLRRCKLDELPQLWNVLRGDMSFVGPRPEVPRYVAFYTEEQRQVLKLRPGITDEASIEFRDEEALLATAQDPERFYVEQCIPRKIALNLEYARRASLWADIGVILRTVGLVWFRRSPP